MAPPPVAAPPPAAPAAPAAAAAPTWKDLITIGGLVDAYYMYNFTGQQSFTSPQGNPIATRSFDINSNEFTLNYAKVSVGVAPKPVGLQLDVGYGATGLAVNTSGPLGAMPPALNPVLVEQAYATLSFGNLTLDMGKFTTWAGAEVIEANLNPNYSRSIMFFYIPLLHNGIRAAYQVNSQLAVKLAVVNGWNDIGFEPATIGAKTIGFEIAYTMPDTTALTLNGYFGKQPPVVGTGTNWRSLVDLVAARSFGPLALTFNFDYIHENQFAPYDGTYVAAALMGKYPVNDMFWVAARGEVVKFAKAGAIGATPAEDKTPMAEEFTITGAVPLGGRLEIRGEIRGDFATVPTVGAISQPAGKNFNNQADSSVFTGTLAFLAWF